MTIKQTKERIAATPDGDLFTFKPPTVKQEQDGVSGYWPVDITKTELSALSDSHTKLLEAAKVIRNSLDGKRGYAFADSDREQLDVAIEEAEQ